MRNIRIGNDIRIGWTVTRNGQPENFYGKDLMLLMSNEYRTQEVTDYEVQDNVLSFTFWGKDQKSLGSYSFTLIENNGEEGMYTLDACDAFRLVARSCMEGGESSEGLSVETVQLSGDLAVPANGLSAYEIAVKNGFVGTEQQWLASLKGPKGDALTYEDLTPAQIAELQKPATDAAQTANQAAQNAITAGNNANTAAENANNAVQAALQAKELLFRDMWNAACGSYGRYNEETGFYELNGLTDITYEQAVTIYNFANETNGMYPIGGLRKGRTNLWLSRGFGSPHALNAKFYCSGNNDIEIVVCSGGNGNFQASFQNCKKLKTIKLNNLNEGGFYYADSMFGNDNFKNLPELEYFMIVNTGTKSFTFCKDSPKLLSVCFKKMIDGSTEKTTPITITVNATVYAKLTDESNAEWFPLLQTAINKNISFATV